MNLTAARSEASPASGQPETGAINAALASEEAMSSLVLLKLRLCSAPVLPLVLTSA
jgi:hypothetical protein